MAWRWASASVTGTSHLQAGIRRQDAYAVSRVGHGGIFAIVSDGAGSSKFGGIGAWIVCRYLTIRFREWARETSEPPSDSDLKDWIDELRDRIAVIASQRAAVRRQFACTVAAILVSPDVLMTVQVGDSAIVARKHGVWDVLCWPENGEYASTTYFITDDPEPRLSITRWPHEHDAFALFSDGLGDLALSHREHAAHHPFFGPMLRPVDSELGEGYLAELSSKLAMYLAGPSVCERTDDDKTLILISGS